MEDVRPILWSSVKSLARETLRTGGNIMTEITANPGQTGDILSKHATETTQNIIKNCAVVVVAREREHLPANRASIRPRPKIAKRKSSSKRKAPSKTIKRDIFS